MDDGSLEKYRTHRLHEDPTHPKLCLYTNNEGWSWQHANNPRFLEWLEMGVPAMLGLNNEDN